MWLILLFVFSFQPSIGITDFSVTFLPVDASGLHRISAFYLGLQKSPLDCIIAEC